MLSDDPNNNSLGEFTPQFQKSVQVYFLSRSSFGGVLVPILFLCVIPILIWMAFESIFHTSYGAANSGRNTCGLEEDGFSVLYTYVAVPTIGCAGATLTTQALNMLTIEHGDRVKVMRLSVVVISLIAITQQTIWISNPPLSICDLEPRAISVLILATEYFVTTPLLLYMNLALDPFKDKLVREDYYIICSSVAAVLFFFASNVASHSHTGPHGDVHSLMTISGRAYMNGTAENPMLVLLLLASAGILFVYSLAATLRQSYRTYQVALIGTKMGASQVRVTGGKDMKGTDSGSLMVEVAMKASTRKLYLAVFLCAMYVPAGVFYFMVATGRLRYVFCSIFLPFFLVCDVSLYLSYPSVAACLHSLTPHGTSLTTISPQSINTHITYNLTGTCTASVLRMEAVLPSCLVLPSLRSISIAYCYLPFIHT
jgi:hypothetical protein